MAALAGARTGGDAQSFGCPDGGRRSCGHHDGAAEGKGGASHVGGRRTLTLDGARYLACSSELKTLYSAEIKLNSLLGGGLYAGIRGAEACLWKENVWAAARRLTVNLGNLSYYSAQMAHEP